MKRALLLQLPAPDFRWPLADPNLPLAAGYLAAWAGPRVPGWRIEILPTTQADTLGDLALLDAIRARRPDLVGLSVYLWNAERSAHLARRLLDTGLPVAVGGPEVAADNRWLTEAMAGCARIAGEGEAAFAQLLLRHGHGDTADPGPPCAPVNLHELASPYLDRLLVPAADGSIWLDTLRGCPFGCLYCNYGKGAGPPRGYRPGWLADHLRWARGVGAREVYLMDPSFNVRGDWPAVLETLERENGDRELRLHTEVVADRLVPRDAGRLAEAGLVSCELGLQSSNPAVLKGVRRPWDRGRWLQGAKALADAGVHSVVGLILGLPGDTSARFRRSVEFVGEHLPDADLQVFPLALLPGTALRNRAGELGLDADPLPPYSIRHTPTFSWDALRESLDWFEQSTGVELDPTPPPDVSGAASPSPDGPYVSGALIHTALLRRCPAEPWIDRLTRHAARTLTLWVRGWDEELPGWINALLQRLPHGVLTLVLDDGCGWPPERLGRLLRSAPGEHFLDRQQSLLYGTGARLIPRLAVLLDADAAAPEGRWLAAVRSRSEVLWNLAVGPAGWEERLQERIEAGEWVRAVGRIEAGELQQLAASLGEGAAALQFGDPDLQARWRSAVHPGTPWAEDHWWELR